MTNEVVTLLSEAQELIRDPKDWCQHGGDDNSQGPHTAMGAFCQVLQGTGQVLDAYNALKAAALTLGYSGISELNDRADHNTVMKMFALAKEMAAQEGAA